MNRNPYLYNSIAEKILGSYAGELFENEKADPIIYKMCDQILNIFKIINFDLAKNRDRNPDVMRDKLSDLAKSRNVKSLTGKIIDYSDESELSDYRFAETKRLYLESLKKFVDALNASSEITNGKSDEIILKKFKKDPSKIQVSLDSIAEKSEKDEEKSKDKKSLSESLFINESVLTGYEERLTNIKKILSNLITSSEGKDQNNGYGRDWKRMFIELDQRRRALDKSGSSEREMKILEDLEKKVDKFQEEFNKSLITASNRALKQLEDDDELYSSYSDVIELNQKALDDLTRAQAEYSIVYKEIRDSQEAKENETGKMIFPIKLGDSDSDKKFKDSGLIFSIQTALCNGIPSAGNLIRSKKGLNGKFGPSTKAVVSTIQKVSGNKNANGEIDKALLDSILASDWISIKDRNNIVNCINKIKSQISESLSEELTGFKLLKEEKIYINNSEFEKELESQYKLASPDTSDSRTEDVEEFSKKSTGVDSLARKLRTNYNLKIEGDDFLKSDGSLKSSYSLDFISSWNKATDGVNPIEDFSYFYTKGGVYNINLSSSSLKTPCNWTKWAEVRRIKNLTNEDCLDFISNYLKGWKTFGMINPDIRYKGIRELNKKLPDEIGDSRSFESVYLASTENGKLPFIKYEFLRGQVAKSIKTVLQVGEKSPDLNSQDFSLLNNILIMISNCVSFDGDRFISCIKWIHDNVMGESVCNRIIRDSVIFSMDDVDSGDITLLGFEKNGIYVSNKEDLLDRLKKEEIKDPSRQLSGFYPIIKIPLDKDPEDSGIKEILAKNLYYISSSIYPSISSHLKRMNSISFEEIPQNSPFKCINTDES